MSAHIDAIRDAHERRAIERTTRTGDTMDALAPLERALAASERALAQETRDVEALEDKLRVVEENIDEIEAENARLREVLRGKRAELSAAKDDKVCVAQELHARAEAVKEMEELLRARDDAETLAKARRLRALREEIDKEEYMHTAMKARREDMEICQKIRELTRDFEGGPLVTEDDEISERVPADIVETLRHLAETRADNEAKKRSIMERGGGDGGGGADKDTGTLKERSADVVVEGGDD